MAMANSHFEELEKYREIVHPKPNEELKELCLQKGFENRCLRKAAREELASRGVPLGAIPFISRQEKERYIEKMERNDPNRSPNSPPGRPGRDLGRRRSPVFPRGNSPGRRGDRFSRHSRRSPQRGPDGPRRRFSSPPGRGRFRSPDRRDDAFNHGLEVARNLGPNMMNPGMMNPGMMMPQMGPCAPLGPVGMPFDMDPRMMPQLLPNNPFGMPFGNEMSMPQPQLITGLQPNAGSPFGGPQMRDLGDRGTRDDRPLERDRQRNSPINGRDGSPWGIAERVTKDRRRDEEDQLRSIASLYADSRNDRNGSDERNEISNRDRFDSQRPRSPVAATRSESRRNVPENTIKVRVSRKTSDVPFSDNDMVLFGDLLCDVQKRVQGKPPKIWDTERRGSALVITCADQSSKEWLLEYVPRMVLRGEQFHVGVENAFSIIEMEFPPSDKPIPKLLLQLEVLNEGLDTSPWAVLGSETRGRSKILTIKAHAASVRYLEEAKNRLFFGLQPVKVLSVKPAQ